jgi:hypothetical protein
MKFSATLRGVAYSDPQEFAAAVKAAPPLEPYSRAGKPVKVQMADLPPKSRPIFKKPSVTLTADEKQWLGRTLWLSGVGVGQVWCLGQQKRSGSAGTLWVAADGKLTEVEIDRLDVLAP